MSLQLHRVRGLTIVALAVTALTAPSAFAADFRSPDTRGAALAADGGISSADLRSPDTREAAGTADPSSAVVDRRSPDTRDVAAGLVRIPATGPIEIGSRAPSGFQWAEAGIGMAAGAGLVLLVVGTSLLIRLARTGPRPT